MAWTYDQLASYDMLLQYDTLSSVVAVPTVIEPGTPAPSPEPLLLPGVAWTVDGKQVQMTDWSATSVAPGGFDQMRGAMTADEWLGLDAGQGSVVRATSGAQTLFDGRLAVGARVQGERATIAAQGLKVKAERYTARLLIQSRNTELWSEVEGDPFVDADGSPIYPAYKKIDTRAGGRIRFSVEGGQALLTDRQNGVGVYEPGVGIQRVAYTFGRDPDDSTNNLAIRVAHANGPAGSATFDPPELVCSAANGTEVIHTWDPTSQDLVMLVLYTHADFTPGENRVYRLTEQRIWGAVDIGRSGDADIFYSDEVISYIGEQMGWDTSGVQTVANNILPFDWSDDWASALDYVAELDDKVWGVWEDSRLTYTPWGSKVWRVYLGVGAEADLMAQERFNVVRVTYETPRGRPRRVTARADPDPLPEDNVYAFELQDRQHAATFAQSVANTLVTRESRERFAGRVNIIAAFDEAGTNDIYGPRAGDVCEIADWAPGRSLRLRIVETEATPDGMTLGVEQPINLSAILEDAVRRPKRRHRTKGRR